MELKWMLDFISLANTGSFSKASKERNVTQSAFSRRIRSLEDWLDTPLVNRETHPITLTDSGIRFVETAKLMVAMAYKVKEDFGSQGYTQRQVIYFLASTNLATYFLPNWLKKIEPATGPIEATIITDVAGVHAHFENLTQQESDFLLYYGHGIDSLAMDANKFEKLTIGKDVLIPVCHSSLKETRALSLPGTSNDPLPYISPMHTSVIAKSIADNILQREPRVFLEHRFKSSTFGCTRGLVMQGYGFAWLPYSVIQKDMENNELIAVGDEQYHISIPIEIYRYISNTKPNVLKFWEQISSTNQEI